MIIFYFCTILLYVSVAGYLHIDMFPMADEGDIEEFVVGQNGCEVFRKVQQPVPAQPSAPAQRQQQQQQKTSGRHR